jgi:hypothetical protein
VEAQARERALARNLDLPAGATQPAPHAVVNVSLIRGILADGEVSDLYKELCSCAPPQTL